MQEEIAEGRNIARANATKTALMDAAKSLFINKGYAETGTPEIVKNAGVTRGALYHHFDGKEGLLRAVLEREAMEISEEIRLSAVDFITPRDALRQGAQAYFRAMADKGRQRLMLRDGPAILGPDGMAEIDREAGSGGLADGLAMLMGDGAPERGVIEAMSEILSAGFDRAAQSPERQEDFVSALEFLFDALGAWKAPNAG